MSSRPARRTGAPAAAPKPFGLLQSPAAAIALLAIAAIAWAVNVRTRSSPVDRHLDRAAELVSERRGADAEREWRAAAHIDPRDPRPWTLLGEYYLATRQWALAYDALQQLAVLKPTAPHLDAEIALAALHVGDTAGAYRCADAALKRDPDDAATTRLLAGLLVDTGQDAQRIDLLRRLARIEPYDEADQVTLAEALVGKRLFAEALPVVEECLRRDPANPQAHALHGMILFSTEPSPAASRRAQVDLLAAAHTARFRPFADFYLGKICDRLGEPARAVPLLEAAVKAMPHRREALFALATAYRETGQAARAAQTTARFDRLRAQEARIDALTTRCTASPQRFADQVELASLLADHGDYDNALRHLAAAAAVQPDDARVARLARSIAASRPGQPTSGRGVSAGVNPGPQ